MRHPLAPTPVTMRMILAVGLFAITYGLSAQLINGSFETDGSPSLSGWEWTCDDPQFVEEGAPGSGAWSVSKMPGHAKGCFPNHLYQRLSNVEDGDIMTITGWGRCPTEFDNICLGARMGLGSINTGAVFLEEFTTASDPLWTFMSITDTVQIGTGDTALVVLNAGFIGGPISPTSPGFDGIEVSISTGVDLSPAPTLHLLRTDANTLMVSTGALRMSGIACFDLAGQVLAAPALRLGTNAYSIGIQSLSSGVYLLRATTEAGVLTTRFVK